MGLGKYLLLGALALSGSSYDLSRVDERSDLIARMKKTMASQDTVKEDPRDRRDKLVSARECAILLEDLGFDDEYAYDSGAVSISDKEERDSITIYLNVGTYSPTKKITLVQAKTYLDKREKKK